MNIKVKDVLLFKYRGYSNLEEQKLGTVTVVSKIEDSKQGLLGYVYVCESGDIDFIVYECDVLGVYKPHFTKEQWGL